MRGRRTLNMAWITMERKQQPTTEGGPELLVYKMKCTSRSQIQTQENKKANIYVKH